MISCAMGAVLAFGSDALGQRDGRSAIVVTQSVNADGTLGGPVTVIVSDGLIERVERGESSVRGIGQVWRYDGVLCPGLIDLDSGLGMTGGRMERSQPIDDSLTALDGFDAQASSVARAASSGVTSALVGAWPNQLVGGVSSLVSTGGGGTSVIKAEGPLMITLAPSTWDADLGPSSRAGALFDLRAALTKAQENGGDTRLGRFVRGELDGFIRAESVEDVDAALDVAVSLGIEPAIAHTDDAVESASMLENWGGVVVVGSYDFGSDIRALTGAKALSEAGVEIAFRGNDTVHSIRRTAYLAVQYGLDAAAARRGLTVNAARVCGAEDLVGSLKPGARADLVIYSGDPLSLASGVVDVFIGGDRYGSSEALGNTTGGWEDREHIPGRE